MSSRNNVDASLWNLYCFTGTWGYTFKPPTRKKDKKKKPWCEWKKEAMMWMKRNIFHAWSASFSSCSFSYKFGNSLNYFCANDLSFTVQIKPSGHFNLSTFRICSQLKWKFFMNTQNVVVFSIVLCGVNETSEFSLGGGSPGSILFLVKWSIEQK